uniref:HDC19714 n=1 Tax=Drosophila melanogaster TaxID=7227 RepID=Q6II50_DROME|nr:TPA_inf: HDC19714 [Drosophila melanogaster]
MACQSATGNWRHLNSPPNLLETRHVENLHPQSQNSLTRFLYMVRLSQSHLFLFHDDDGDDDMDADVGLFLSLLNSTIGPPPHEKAADGAHGAEPMRLEKWKKKAGPLCPLE